MFTFFNLIYNHQSLRSKVEKIKHKMKYLSSIVVLLLIQKSEQRLHRLEKLKETLQKKCHNIVAIVIKEKIFKEIQTLNSKK